MLSQNNWIVKHLVFSFQNMAILLTAERRFRITSCSFGGALFGETLPTDVGGNGGFELVHCEVMFG